MKYHILQDRFFEPGATPLGRLQLGVFTSNMGAPVSEATVKVMENGTGKVVEEMMTDTSGQTAIIDLPCPPLEYSLAPGQPKPYSEYTVEVTAEDFEPIMINGIEVLDNTTSLQSINLNQREAVGEEQIIDIKPHTLWATYPPKTPEDAVKPLNDETGFIVLDKPVVPEFIVVHDGLPSDANAPNYYIRFTDYIKNVATSEIYATWPTATITANILAILSFTLNRVFTEWYRNKGYNFTITSSTEHVRKW